MNEENLINEIKLYMENPLNYAILLDGKWGSGKTYFIKNKLNEFNSIYISLYGINSISNLSFQLFYECIKEKKIFKNPILKKFNGNKVGTASGIILNTLENKFNISITDIYKLLSDFNLDGKLIIVDDLERSTVPINEILGFFNNLVEHNNAKVLLIANEEEIVSNNNDYGKIKEKMIYQTFMFMPDLNKIYDILYINESNSIIQENKDFIIEALTRNGHYNIRTIQFIIQRYKELESKLCDFFSSIDDCDICKIIKNNLFKYLTIISIKYKMGDSLPEFDENKNISYYELSWGSYFVITGFKFLNDYILGFQFDKNEIEKILNEYLNDLYSSVNNINSPLEIMNNWTEADDNIIEDETEKILGLLQNNKITFDLYLKILCYLVSIKNCGFSSNYLYNAFSFMKANINSSSELINLGNPLIYFINDDIKEQYDIQKRELDNIVDVHNKALQDDCFMGIRLYKIGDIGEKLYNKCIDERNIIFKNKSLLNTIKIENVLYVIENGNAKDVRQLIFLFNEMYNYYNAKEMFPDELLLIDSLLKEVEYIDSKKFNKIKKYNYNDLINDLNQFKEKFI